MNYKTIKYLDDHLIYLLQIVNCDKLFRDFDEFKEYILEKQFIFEFEVYENNCWDLAKLLSFEGYDLIEYTKDYDYKNIVDLVDLLIQNYFLDHCRFNEKTQKIMWSKSIEYNKYLKEKEFE